jgi:hypothetical protein
MTTTNDATTELTFTIDQVNALTEKARGLRAFITAMYIRDGALHLDLQFYAPKGLGWKRMGQEFWRWDGNAWQTR